MSLKNKISISLVVSVIGVLVLMSLSLYKDQVHNKTTKRQEFLIDSLKIEIYEKDIIIDFYNNVMDSTITELDSTNHK